MKIIRNNPFLFSYFLNFLFSYRLSAKEETGDADEVHQLGKQEASHYAKGEGDYQEEESCRIELEIRDKLLTENGKDGRENVEGKAVATPKGEKVKK